MNHSGGFPIIKYGRSADFTKQTSCTNPRAAGNCAESISSNPPLGYRYGDAPFNGYEYLRQYHKQQQDQPQEDYQQQLFQKARR